MERSSLFEQKVNQVTVLTKFSQYQDWFMLGFGASGKELEQKWDIKYLGSEKIDGIKTDKLEMIAKDPAVRKNVLKLTLWMDSERGGERAAVVRPGTGADTDLPLYEYQSESGPAVGCVYIQNQQADANHHPVKSNSGEHKQHREALERISGFGCFHGEQ